MSTRIDHYNPDHEGLLLSLANEIATDLLPLETILKNHQISQNDWQTISKQPRFQMILAEAVREWEAADNVGKRLTLKFKLALEQTIPEMFQRLHDPEFNDAAKVKLFEVMQKGAGIGDRGNMVDAGPGVSITIKMDSDTKALPPTVIEGVAIDVEG